VSLIGVGGYHIGMAWDEEESIRIVRNGARQRSQFSRQLPGS
jgi:hypothetical protein